MRAMIRRNVLLFFRDKLSVFFSMLGVLIIFMLYLLFLGNMMESNLPQGADDTASFMSSWIMGGTLAVSTITTTMGAVGLMVEDKSKKIAKDFQASPLSRRAVVGGYMISTVIIGLLMGLITLAMAEGYIVLKGGELLTLLQFAKVLGILVLSVLASSSMMFLLVSFLKTSNAFATCSTLVGTLIGFMTGVYMPVGILPTPVQWVVKLFPVSHAGLLFRRVMMEAPMKTAYQSIAQAGLHWEDGAAFDATAFNQMLGIEFEYGGHVAPPWVSVAVLAATTVVFFLLSVWSVSRKQK